MCAPCYPDRMNNPLIYNAVLTGISGSTQNLTIRSSRTADYNDFGTRAALLALAVDSLIAPTTVSEDEARLISAIAGGIDFNRCLQGTTPNYSAIAADIVRIWTEMNPRLLGGSGNTDVLTVNTFADLRTLTTGAYAVVEIKGHTVAGLGSGTFDRYPAGGYVDDNGTVAVAGVFAYVRRNRFDVDAIPSTWFGALEDWNNSTETGTDDTAAVFAALDFANGLLPGAIYPGTEGDHNFGDTGRLQKPIMVTGPTRLTAPIPLRYRGIQIIGPTRNSVRVPGSSPALITDHNGHGIILDTGTDPLTLNAPSLAIDGVDIVRPVSKYVTGLDGIYLDGINWFYGLRISNAHIRGHRDGLGVSAAYIASAVFASGLVISDTAFITNNRNLGINLPIFWDLSDLRAFSCMGNAVAGFDIGLRGGVFESVDTEGQPYAGTFKGRGCRIGGFYAEVNTPESAYLVKVRISTGITCTPCMNATVARYHNYLFTNSLNCISLDNLPVRSTASHGIQSAAGWYPLKASTDPSFHATHTVERSTYLQSLTALPVLSSSVWYYAPYYTTTMTVLGRRLPGRPIGTGGSPAYRVSTGINGPFTAGHVYLIAFTVGYTADQVNNTDQILLFYAGSGSADFAWQSPGLREIKAGMTRQHVLMFCPSVTTASVTIWTYPYGTGAGDTGASAIQSEFYVAELDTGLPALPQFEVSALLLGAPLEATAVLNGATPVNIADTGVKDTSEITVIPTAFGGTPGPIQVSRTAGVQITLTGVAGDTSTVQIRRT